jgi:sugar porter (SP) family MFS transporter
MIAFVAALGGLLFGYDWVVIGGAKPFYEAYFHLTSDALIGWANSCALVGCLAGALAAGVIARALGRKPVLLLAAFIFAVSSVFTGWSHLFALFVAWRILGGFAIGLASNVSPVYIAEVSPAVWRGRLVALNQLALVIGILAAQIVNWAIARPVPEGATMETIASSWNALYGWRWMFTAVTFPAIIFFLGALWIPESPRWLALQGLPERSRRVLQRIGGESYADAEMRAISAAIPARGAAKPSLWQAFRPPSARRLLILGVALAVLQQWSGINVLFNYAEEVYKSAGYGMNAILFNIVITGIVNLVFTIVAMLFVDRIGRRGLMIFGCIGIGFAHLGAGAAYRAGLPAGVILLLTLLAIACYAVSLAPVTWVLIAEIFPNRIRDFGVSIAIASLWCASFTLTYSFPVLNVAMGTGGTFFLYSGICFAGAWLVISTVEETKGKSLEEIESSN